MNPSRFARSRKIKAALAAALLTGLGLYTLGPLASAQQQPQAANSKQGPVDREQLRPAFALSEAFRQVARSIGPSVVNIRNTQKLNVPAMNQEQDDDQNPSQNPGQMDPNDLFRRFFGDVPDGGLRQFRFGAPSTPMPRERIGEGTGVIAREDGYILTNNHVVEGATELRVKLDDDREYDANVIGTDPDTDLAVVKIDASGLIPVKLGDSDAMQVGDWVLAMGSPFGLQHTVTAGIVSAKGRANMGITTFEDFIQTDAAINPGNSGGPLTNLYGEVIGINTAISTRTGSYNGVGFAIPSNMAKNVLKSIIDKGKVQRGWLGVKLQPLTEDLANSFNYNGTHGALIDKVYPDTPASKAGLQDGDIVVRVDGKAVNSVTDLLNTVANTAPGDKIQLEVFREGKTRDFTVTLGDRSAAPQVARASEGTEQGRNGTLRKQSNNLGITVQPLTSDLSRQLGATDVSGVVVTRIDPNAPAAQAGVQMGDIISKIGNNEVRNSDDFNNALQNLDLSRGVRLQVYSKADSGNYEPHYLFVKAEKR